MPSKIKHAALRQKTSKKTQTHGRAKARASTPTKPQDSANKVVVAGVALSHPDRVYWEDVGVTKQMLADYYQEVWEWMRPHATGRVLALLRCPDGQTAACFYQKHASAGVDAKRLHLVPEPDGDKSISIDDLAGLISLAQAGVLEFHARGSRIDNLEAAERLVFDLDPGPGVGWKDVVAAAREVRERLAALDLDSFVKTTGGKGLHVVLPIRAVPWDDAKEFCREFATRMAADSPERFTAIIRKAARDRKIFIDYLRNSREATAIVAYSTRARPGATVATPVSWNELGTLGSPGRFDIHTVPKRLSRMRKDPWADIGRLRQKLPKNAGK
jgi:bifunctional non-homologous end joining protein LigD